MFDYPVTLTRDDDTVLVTFTDMPESQLRELAAAHFL